MKERHIVLGILATAVTAGLLISGNTDAYFFVGGTAFFVLSMGYAEWCEKL